MELSREHPLDGLENVPWADLLGPDDAAELVAALRELAEEGGSDHRIYDVLEDGDNFDHYWFATVAAKPEGLRPAAVPALRFLARIAAQPSGVGSWSALDLVETIVDAALDRPTMTGDELDALVDGLRAEFDTARPALAEADRQSHGEVSIPRLVAEVDAGVRLGGAYEPRWRGVARPLVESPTGRLVTAGGMLVTQEKGGLVFRSLDDGTPIHVFDYPGAEKAWPFAGSRSDPGLRDAETELWATPFADADGPGVLTVEARGRDALLWRLDGTGWRAIPLVRSGWRLRSPARRVDVVAAYGGTCFVGYADNVVLSFDARSGMLSGEPITLPRGARHLAADGTHMTVLLHHSGSGPNLIRIDLATGRLVEPTAGPADTLPFGYHSQGRPHLVFKNGFTPGPQLHRVDAGSNAEVGQPIRVGDLNGFCVYEVGGRPCLAVAGLRQVHRFDAETGEPIGRPLFGHRRIVLDVVSAVVDGRPTLYSADGATVRRWDAETGIPWPAPIP